MTTKLNATEARALVNPLRNGQQCDEDGVMCIISRQLCHEAADAITAALDEIERLETQIRSLDHALNFILSDAAWTPKHPACESIIARINALRKGDDK